MSPNSRLSVGLVSLFMCTLVTVKSQPTTTEDDNFNFHLLMNDNAMLRKELAELKTMIQVTAESQPTTTEDDNLNENAMLRKELAELKTMIQGASKQQEGHIGTSDRGTSYVRWGRKTCEGNATVVYEGYAAGAIHNFGGGGANFLCLPKDPDWDNFIDGPTSLTGHIGGVEYELYSSNNVFSESNTGNVPLTNNPAPCAVCYLARRSTVLMVPAKTQCPDGWNKEYGGYLASAYSTSGSGSRKRSNFICWDRAPEIASGGFDQDQAVIYPVEVKCGTLPCSTYISDRELTCVVCSK